MKTCFFTGHRKIPKSELSSVISRTNEAIIACIESGCTNFKVGGALGFDTVAAFCVIAMRRIYPNIRMIMVLPCKDQSHGWNKDDTNRYEYTKSMADEILYISENYHKGCMRKRNQALVFGSDIGICYFKGISGGTYQTIAMAQEAEIDIINVYRKLK